MPETNLQPRGDQRLEELLLQLQAKLDDLSMKLAEMVVEVQALRQWLEARP